MSRYRGVPSSDPTHPIDDELKRADSKPKHLRNVISDIWSSYAPIVFGIRIVAALVQQTAYVPDEFYQSTDVVHNFVLNQTDVTWEWKYPIRTSIWFFPIALLGRVLHMIGVYRFVNIQTILRYVAYKENRLKD